MDALSNPLEVHRSQGQDADFPHAETLLVDHQPDAVLADKGYDTNHVIATITEPGAEAVIPPNSNRVESREYDETVWQ